MIEDIIGKPVLAIDVIAHLIRALADHAMTAMEAQGTRVNTNDKRIQWVLTVPAIWTDNSENFMTDCAEKAGIQQDHLLLIKQQEAALIYCHHLPLNKVGDAELSGEETKCMVVDLGGTTVDISVFGKLVKGGEKELGRITRGDCGGTSVDNGFIQLFENILGKHLLNTMEREHFKDYLDLLTGWEASKRTFKADDEISINVPNQTLDSLCKRHLQKDFSTVLESTYANSISIKFNKMRIDRDLSKSIFDNTIKRILKLLQELFTVFDFQTEELIFLVGGFSECKLIQLTIKDAFPMKTILVPEPTDLATLKGAVLYGHNNEKCYDLLQPYEASKLISSS
ncbi:heat shock 70 kDa protein 12B-like [Mytilus trossulus]|uniref:heat shock 70 kDa protein 12B-like n=1 Tax=Mytilus trossulus TaxID=6551 RepID=UPI003004E4E5